ncbi:MAG TPA: baseplate J/gp47 family protein [Candidatus Dormibacteraeota bacterium]
MAANPIYVETEEEIPEIIERVRRTAADEIPLVLPSRSRFGQSRFNFQLLRQYAARLGKEVSIVSPDPAVQQMAAENGFRAFPRIDEAAAGERREVQAGAAAALATATPPAPAVSTPRLVVKAPPRLPSKVATQVAPGRFLLYMGAGLMLVAGLVGGLLYVPSAQVTLTANATPFNVDNMKVDATAGQPPVRLRAVSITRQASGGFTATGVKTIPGTVATGWVTYTNNCPDLSLTIYDGFRLRAIGGIQFAQKGAPGGSVVVGPKGGDRGPWSVSAPIIATSPGASGNVGAGSIVQIESNYGQCVTVTNPGPTTGGQDEQKQTILQTSDVETARSALDAQIRKTIQDDLLKQVSTGEKLSDQIVFQPPDFNTDHKVGDVATAFSATMSLTAEGDIYVADDVVKAFGDLLQKKVPQGQQLTDNKPNIDYQVTNASSGGHVQFTGKASAFLAPKIDFDQLRGQLAAKTLPVAQSELTKMPIRSADIHESPFKLPFMPLTASRIHITYEVEPSVSPSPSPKSS